VAPSTMATKDNFCPLNGEALHIFFFGQQQFPLVVLWYKLEESLGT